MAGRSSATTPDDLYRNLDVLIEVLEKVQQNYVDEVDSRALVQGSLRGMLREIDPFSQYLDPQAWDNLKATTQGSFGGIGIEVTVRDDYPTVIAPIEGSPAWTLGLRPGDVIVRIEGASAAHLTVEEVAHRLRGPAGTQVRIAVRREGEAEDIDYTIERQIITTHSVPHAFVLGDGLGYLRVANFSETSGAAVRDALGQLRAGGATRLVLDLRANPGGLLDQAVNVVEQFVPANTLVVFTRGRGRNTDQRFYTKGLDPQLTWPMVVLIDGGSASAAEIVAGSLQDLDRALIVGEVSFGKGSVQSVFPLRGERAALKLTTSRYFTPSGRSIHRVSNDRPGRAAAQASQLVTDEDEDGEGATPAPATADSAPRPEFRTAAGRRVLGGGGIQPDLNVPPDSLPPLTRRVETRSLAFRFANRWVNQGGAEAGGVSAWQGFVAFLGEQGFPVPAAELAAERPALERAVRRELARRSGGNAAAARLALEGDAPFLRAREILVHARSPQGVFAQVDAPVPGAR